MLQTPARVVIILGPYLVINNGIIICFGRTPYIGNRQWTTLPITYKTIYSVNVSYYATNLSNGAICVNSKNVSGFGLMLWDGYSVMYICVGY